MINCNANASANIPSLCVYWMQIATKLLAHKNHYRRVKGAAKWSSTFVTRLTSLGTQHCQNCIAYNTNNGRLTQLDELILGIFGPQIASSNMAKAMEDFYLRYYVGHKGKFGHEFLEFEFRPDGKLRYANNSNYKNDTMIRKEAYVHHSVMEELKRVIVDSEIMQEDDSLWPPPDRVGRQVRQTFAMRLCAQLTIFVFTGIGNCHWRRAHLIHHIQNGFASRCQSVQRSRRPARFLLFGAGSQVFSILAHRIALQN